MRHVRFTGVMSLIPLMSFCMLLALDVLTSGACALSSADAASTSAPLIMALVAYVAALLPMWGYWMVHAARDHERGVLGRMMWMMALTLCPALVMPVYWYRRVALPTQRRSA